MDHLAQKIYKYLTPSNIYIVQSLTGYQSGHWIHATFSTYQLAEEYVNREICKELLNELEKFIKDQQQYSERYNLLQNFPYFWQEEQPKCCKPSERGCDPKFWIKLIKKYNLQINFDSFKIMNPLTSYLITNIADEYQQRKSLNTYSCFNPLRGYSFQIIEKPLHYNNRYNSNQTQFTNCNQKIEHH